MIVMRVCSFMVNGPGLRVHSFPNVVNVLFGMYFAQKFPRGYATNCAMRVDTDICGLRIENSVLRPDPMIANRLPMIQTRIVSWRSAIFEVIFTQAISGSSVFETAARTSSYGESSSNIFGSSSSESTNSSSSRFGRNSDDNEPSRKFGSYGNFDYVNIQWIGDVPISFRQVYPGSVSLQSSFLSLDR